MLSMLTNLGSSMDFSYFSFILISKANQGWTIQLSFFSAPESCDEHSCCAVSSTLLSPCHQQPSWAQGCCSHQWWRATAQPRGEKGILGTLGSSLTKHDRQESQSSAKINPASAYDWGLAQPTADTAAQWETDSQITSCSVVSLSGMGFFLPPSPSIPPLVSFLVVLEVFFLFLQRRLITVQPPQTHTSLLCRDSNI